MTGCRRETQKPWLGWVTYQQLSKRNAEFCQCTKLNNSMRKTRPLGNCEILDTKAICNLGGLPQRHPLVIILELPCVFFRNRSFLRSQGVDKPRDPRSLPISNIIEQFLHQNPTQGHYKAELMCHLCSIWRTQATEHSKR
jgi:hypothetical protein